MTEHDTPHDRYEHTKKSVYNSQHDVAHAWVEGKYPAESGTAIVRNSSKNFKGIQRPDGSGVLRHYRTIEAMRTKNGMILNNSQCWARGWAKCTTPPNIDYTLPLTALESELRPNHKLKDITDVRQNGSDYIIEVGTDAAYYIGTDPSIINGGNTIMMRLEPGERVLVPQQVTEELLRPEEVKESDMQVVDSSEYTKTRFTDPSDEVIERENLKEDQSRWASSDRYKNHKAYLEKYQGTAIVRHGEWFFIPAPEFEPGHMDEPTEPASPTDLGSHTVKRKDGAWRVGDTVYVRGSVGHSTNDHNTVNLGDTWHKAVTHNRDVQVIDGTGSGRAD